MSGRDIVLFIVAIFILIIGFKTGIEGLFTILGFFIIAHFVGLL